MNNQHLSNSLLSTVTRLLKKRFKDSLKISLNVCLRPGDSLSIELFEDERRSDMVDERRNQATTGPTPDQTFPCSHCGRICMSRIGLNSHQPACNRCVKPPILDLHSWRLNSHYLNLEAAEGPASSENSPTNPQMPASMACQDEPSNLECIHKSELFPKKELVTEDQSLQVPFPLLSGESVEYLGRTADGVIALSNFRVLIKFKDSFVNVPIGLIEFVESRDIFHIAIYCKDATVVKCSFTTNESCQDWFKRLNAVISSPTRMEELFAFAFYAWCVDHCNTEQNSSCYQLCIQNTPDDSYQLRFGKEVKRMNFDLKNAWRISYINDEYEACPSYPEIHIVPACISDEDLKSVASFRSMRRFPSVVWRDQRSGAVISRCSQPEIGWLGWRKTEDENLLQAIALACAKNPGTNSKPPINAEIPELADGTQVEKNEMTNGMRDNAINAHRMLIIDARSYSAAIANRAKGGGCECAEYYPNCEIQFMNLANIHSIRKSFCALRTLCGASPDQANWLSGLENTKWLHHIANLLKAACIVANAIHKEGRPVLVHCSDGWDRTPQIVALAELLLDPYYRTSHGFYILVEREWLQFGHKFADRCGHDINADDPNERCPVFLQWLDCVHQIYRQFPCAFEFSEAFLIKLVQHTYSRLFGTFLCNNAQERKKAKLKTKTASVWSLLLSDNKRFTNYLYNPSTDQVLYPSCHVRNLSLWTHVYLSNNSFSTSSDDLPTNSTNDHFIDEPKSDHCNFGKTRSYDDLVALDHTANLSRRLSDPNIAMDNHDPAVFQPKDCTNSMYGMVAVNSNHLMAEVEASQPEELFNGNHPATTEEQADNIEGEEEDDDEQLFRAKEEELMNGEILKNYKNSEVNGNSAIPSYLTSISSKSHRTYNKSSQVPGNESFISSTDTLVDEPHNKLIHFKTDCTTKTSVSTVYTSTSTSNLSGSLYMNGNVEHHNNSSSSSSSSTSSSGEEDEYNSSRCNGERTLQYSISTSTSDISDPRVDVNLYSDIPSSAAPLSARGETDYKSLSRSSLKLNYLFNSRMNISKAESCPSTPNFPMAQCLKKTLTPVTPGADFKVQPLTKPSSIAHNQSSFSLTRHLDPDGLTTHSDTVQQRVNEIRSDYHQKIELQKRHLEQLTTMYQASAYNGTVRQMYDRDEMVSLPESSGSGELHSIGHCSNAASDVSWEHIDEKDSKMTLWVPDHAVTHCAGCELPFWFGRRKHHCRNCGRVFCGECANAYMPIPHQQLTEPARVCRSCLPILQSTLVDNCMMMGLEFEKPFVAAAAAAAASSN